MTSLSTYPVLSFSLGKEILDGGFLLVTGGFSLLLGDFLFSLGDFSLVFEGSLRSDIFFIAFNFLLFIFQPLC